MATLRRLLLAAWRRTRYLRLWRRALTGENRVPRTDLRTLDWARIAAQQAKPIRVLYMLGMPRTGTTLMKHHLGTGPHFVLQPFSHSYYDSWWLARSIGPDRIVVDKRTENILHIDEIWRCFGTECALACIVRDPRDQLLSLLDYPGHRYIPRDRGFWGEWVSRYGAFLALSLRYFMYGRFYLLRYEDLVRFPQQARRDVASWLNLPFGESEAPLTYATANTDYAAALRERNLDPDSLEAWQLAKEIGLDEDYKFHARPEIHDEAIARWKQVTDPETKALIESWRESIDALRLMTLLGYGEDLQPITPGIPGCHVFAPES